MGGAILIIWFFFVLAAVQAEDSLKHLLPTNEHIPKEELERATLEAAKTAALNLNVNPDKTCPVARIESSKGRYGCYTSLYTCDETYSGKCFWTFSRRCICPRYWGLKLSECRIATIKIPHTQYGHVDLPMGKCVPAVWVIITLPCLAIPIIWYVAFRLVRRKFKRRD